jgi:CubicO group peptidase (beta-lactamase class C family)
MIPMHKPSINRSVPFAGMLCILIVFLTDCSSSPATVIPSAAPTLTPGTGAYWPTEAWRSSTPEDQGMDSHRLAQMLDDINQQHLDFHSLLIVRNGYLVSETYFGIYKQNSRHKLYSCTKSVVSTLIGIAIDKGYIDRIDQRIVDFFPAYTFANLDEQKETMTLEDLLTMRSGLDWHEGDPAFAAMYNSPDWVQFMLDMPMAQPPGSQFNYCSGCSHILSAILQQTTGMNPLDFAEQYLFQPLGISNLQWDTDAANIPIGGWGLQITPRDMAKIGYLYLQDGQWDGQQIVSANWVENATRKQTKTDGDSGYGYQWWTYPSLEAYTALGRYGQTIFVIPEDDLVIVTTANMDNHDEIYRLIEQYILPAVQ